MPGYDTNRFINLKDEDELMCSICHGIFINPKVTPCCRQTYCGECIEQWLEVNSSCPNDRQPLYANNLFSAPRIIFNMLNKLLITCEFSEYGCQEIFLLENINTHLRSCLFNPNNICVNCNHTIGNKSEHNCFDNLKSDYLNLTKSKDEFEQKYYFSETKLNLLNEKYENQSIELNNLKENIRKTQKLINQIKEENKSLQIKVETLFSENQQLKGFSSKLYDNLKSIESDIIPLENNDHIVQNEFNTFIKIMENYFERQSNNLNKRNEIKHKLSKFVSNIENQPLLKQINNFHNVMASNFAHELDIQTISDNNNKTINEANIEVDKSRSEATFRFKIEGFSKMRGSRVSPPIFVRNLPWKIKATPRRSHTLNTKCLGFYLQCNEDSDSKTWSCNASAELRIISQKEGVENACRMIWQEFNSQQNFGGFGNYLWWNDILDPNRGHIKDDAVILEVYIAADAPLGI